MSAIINPLANPEIFLLVGAAYMISVLVVVLYHLFAKLMQSPNLDALYKEELNQIILTSAIIGLWGVLAGLAITFSSAIAGTAGEIGHIELAYYALDVLNNRVVDAYLTFYKTELVVGFVSTLGLSIPLPMPVAAIIWVGMAPPAGISLLSNALITLIESTGMALGLLFARKLLLEFFKYIIPGALLPLGLFLRAFPFTRKTGSSLIAICFVGFFVFPLSILLTHSLIFDYYKAPVLIPMSSSTAFCMDEDDFEDWEEKINEFSEENKQTFSDIQGAIEEEIEEGSAIKENAGDESWFSIRSIDNLFRAAADKVGLLGAYDSIKWALGSFADFFLIFWDTGAFLWESKEWSFDFLFSYILLPYGFGAFAFEEVMELIPNAAQIVVLTLVTFVLEIIISVTMYRNISLAIKGEMDILGFTKLV